MSKGLHPGSVCKGYQQTTKVASRKESIDLILYVPVNSFSVMPGQVFLGLTSTKQRTRCLAQGHNAVAPVRIEPATSRLFH